MKFLLGVVIGMAATLGATTYLFSTCDRVAIHSTLFEGQHIVIHATPKLPALVPAKPLARDMYDPNDCSRGVDESNQETCDAAVGAKS